MISPQQFNLPLGVRMKNDGQDSVTDHCPDFVDVMRAEARLKVSELGWVTTDLLRKYAMENGIAPEHPNAWGAIFRGKEWKIIGQTRSKLTSNHARMIRVWTIA